MRAGIFGLMIASAITAGFANADESDQKDSRWTGFYVGVNGGLARSDRKRQWLSAHRKAPSADPRMPPATQFQAICPGMMCSKVLWDWDRRARLARLPRF